MHYTPDQDFPGVLTDEQPAGPSVDERLAAIISPICRTAAGHETQYNVPRPGGPIPRVRLARPPLSNRHNGPTVEYAAGGTYVKVRFPGVESPTKPAKRGIVTDFSAKSRTTMLDRMNQINHDELAQYSYFLTTTYPNVFSRDRKVWTANRRALTKRLKRAYNIQAIVWKLEPQERLAPHYHFLIFSHDEIDVETVAAMWHDIVDTEDVNHLLWHLGLLNDPKNVPCLSRVNSFDGVKHYVSEYCGKKVNGGDLPPWWHGGRWWGIEGKLPIKMQVEYLSVREGVDLNRILRKLFRSKVGRKYKQRGIVGTKIYTKQDTTERAIHHVRMREKQRGDMPQPDLIDLHMLAGIGLKNEGIRENERDARSRKERITNAEKYQQEREQRYGITERTPEDCKTVLEKYGFTGLQERLEKAGVA